MMSLLLVIGMTACSSNQTPTNDLLSEITSQPGLSVDSKTQSSQSESDEPSVGKTLVVYFSATDNTETAANYIAETTGGDFATAIKKNR